MSSVSDPFESSKITFSVPGYLASSTPVDRRDLRNAADRNKPIWQWYGSVSPTLFPLNLVGRYLKKNISETIPEEMFEGGIFH